MRAAEYQATLRPWWPHIRRLLVLGFFVVVGWLLVEQARGIEWVEVGAALRRLPLGVLLIAASIATLSFLLYTTFDLIGRSYTRHTLATHCVMLVAFISYAFNLSLGSLAGAIAFRFRLYKKFGLNSNVITRILGLSMLTNWLGCFTLGGVVLCFFTPELPQEWESEAALLLWLGAGLLALAGGYLYACAFAKRRRWKWRSQTIALPTGRMASLQLALSAMNWMLMAGVIFTLLQTRIPYPTVLGILLMAAVTGLIIRVPAGLGVLEAVFVAMLSSRLPATEVLAGLLAYRAIYYLFPLAVAALLYTRIEWRTHATKRP